MVLQAYASMTPRLAGSKRVQEAEAQILSPSAVVFSCDRYDALAIKSVAKPSGVSALFPD